MLTKADVTGSLIYWNDIVPSHLPHPVTAKPKRSLSEPDDETLFGFKDDDEMADDAHAADLPSTRPAKVKKLVENEAAETNDEGLGEFLDDYDDEAMNDFVVDDDGAGYLADTKNRRDLDRYQAKNQRKTMDELNQGFCF